MKNLVSRFVKDESGATAIEYGLIAAGISVAIIAVVQGLGSKLKYDLHVGSERAQLRPRFEVSGGRLRHGPEPFRFCRACNRWRQGNSSGNRFDYSEKSKVRFTGASTMVRGKIGGPRLRRMGGAGPR